MPSPFLILLASVAFVGAARAGAPETDLRALIRAAETPSVELLALTPELACADRTSAFDIAMCKKEHAAERGRMKQTLLVNSLKIRATDYDPERSVFTVGVPNTLPASWSDDDDHPREVAFVVVNGPHVPAGLKAGMAWMKQRGEPLFTMKVTLDRDDAERFERKGTMWLFTTSTGSRVRRENGSHGLTFSFMSATVKLLGVVIEVDGRIVAERWTTPAQQVLKRYGGLAHEVEPMPVERPVTIELTLPERAGVAALAQACLRAFKRRERATLEALAEGHELARVSDERLAETSWEMLSLEHWDQSEPHIELIGGPEALGVYRADDEMRYAVSLIKEPTRWRCVDIIRLAK